MNWCSHARINCEARGMLAETTDLPIGNHSIQCDFASDDSISFYCEMSTAGLDFHDRNCATCTHRITVRLHDISEDVRSASGRPRGTRPKPTRARRCSRRR